MAFLASQLINNMKSSLNVYFKNELAPTDINFDQDPFDTSGLDSWYTVRYSGYESGSVGMGDVIDSDGTTGRIHILQAEISAWCREDSSRIELGSTVDKLVRLCEEGVISLYDFIDPGNPIEIGKMNIEPGVGIFTPSWSGGTRTSESDIYSRERVAGFILKIKISTITEVS